MTLHRRLPGACRTKKITRLGNQKIRHTVIDPYAPFPHVYIILPRLLATHSAPCHLFVRTQSFKRKRPSLLQPYQARPTPTYLPYLALAHSQERCIQPGYTSSCARGATTLQKTLGDIRIQKGGKSAQCRRNQTDM